jgi:segregation and condensation protein B
MNELEMKHQFEAALLAAGRPVTTQQLAELFDERERPSLEQVLNALNDLRQDYEGRGLELLEVSSGWRIQVRSNCVDFVSRLWQERPARYSRALLETLALIAYRQPITRGEIEEIRGVAVSSTIMRTLHDRNWIRVVGHREVPGRPEVLATTREFLDYFGLKSLDQLPTLAELKDVETIGVQMEFNTNETSAANDDTQPGEDSASEPAVVEASGDADAAPTEIASTAEAEEPPAEAEVENADASEVSAEAEAEGEEDAESAVQAR